MTSWHFCLKSCQVSADGIISVQEIATLLKTNYLKNNFDVFQIENIEDPNFREKFISDLIV